MSKSAYVSIGSAIADLVPERIGQGLSASRPMRLTPGGSGVNAAVVLARFGLPVRLVSRVGSDPVGQWIRAELHAAGVDVTLVGVSERQITSLGVCTMDLVGHKEYTWYRFPGLADPMAELDASEDVRAAARAAGLFHFSEASMRQAGPRRAALAMAEEAVAAGATVAYSANLRMAAWNVSPDAIRHEQQPALRLAHLLMMNEEEALFLSGAGDLAGALDWAQSQPAHTVLITRGMKGALLVHAKTTWDVPALRVPVVFDAGAGDVFHAVFAAGLWKGLRPEAAAYWAAAAAAVKISRPYTLAELPGKEEVRAAMRSWPAARDLAEEWK